MNWGKRIFALMLMVVVTFTGFQFPEITQTTAKAERAPLGTTEVPETPEDLLQSGEWAYWLLNECAIIAGYGNESESTLKIPARLDGYPVVGVGHDAFAENDGLSSVQIHTNVIKIADDAFADGVTIRAYNGSYALTYASNEGFASVNLSTNKFVSDVIDMTGAPSKSYSSLSDSSVTVKVAVTQFLREGDVVYFPPEDGYPTGLAKRVGSISSDGTTATISFTQPQFGEVFTEVEGSEEVYLDWDNAIYPEGMSAGTVTASAASSKTKRSVNLAALDLKVLGKDINVSGTIDIEIGKMKFDYKLGVKNFLPYIKSMKVDLPIKTTPTVKISTDKKILDPSKGTGRIGKRVTIAGPKIPAISAGGVINGYVTLDFVFKVEGELSLSATVETVFTFQIKNGKSSFSKTQNTTYHKTELAASITVGPKFTMYFVLGWSGFSIRFFETSVGAFLIAEGKATYTGGLTGHVDSMICAELSLKFQIAVNFKIGIIKVLGVEGIYYSKTKEFTIPLLSGHFENTKKVSACSLDDRKLVFDATVYSKEQTYNVGELISQPLDPTRKGYRFAGWYIDASKSGWPSSDTKWNFTTMKMPYIKNGGTVYLYAKWTAVKPAATATPKPTTKPTATVKPTTSTTVTPTPVPTATPTPTPAPVLPTSISLNITSVEKYSDDAENTVQLTATVLPSNADDLSVVWDSTNDSVAWVDENGLVTIGNSGTATITCTSVSNPSVSASCAVTVKQHVEEIIITADDDALAPDETLQLTAACYPTNSENKNVVWSTSDASVATVSDTGLVSGLKLGEVTITATATDGTGVSASMTLQVESALTIKSSVVCDTVYTQGSSESVIAYVSPTAGSIRRMAELGHELQWSIAASDGNCDAVLTEIPMSAGEYEGTMVLVSVENPTTAGSKTYTVSCKAGAHESSATIDLTIDGSTYAESVKLSNSTIYLDAGAAATIPATPISGDGNPVPDDMDVTIVGDRYYDMAATETESGSDVSITFSESGIYTATVYYQKGNLIYEVPVSFYVRDEDGLIRLKVTEVALDESFADLVQGDTLQLTAEITPADAYNPVVVWSSSDESVATVDENGLVTAAAPGIAAILCEAADGSGCFAICAVRVESFLSLDEESIDLTLYLDGEDHVDLETVNVSFDSQTRLESAGLNVTWSLERVSGSSTEIALSEFASTGEEGVSVSGNLLKLVRLNGAGEDEFLLTCRAGSYSDQCSVKLTVVDEPLPESVALNQTSYSGLIEETIAIDTDPVCTPEDAALPEDAEITIDGTRVFRNALSDNYDLTEPAELIFSKAGTYSGSVTFSGANYEYVCPIAITVSDADGNVPVAIENVSVTPEEITLLTGEEYALTGIVEPENAEYSQLSWSSYDTGIATVSEDGVVTAIDSGVTSIVLSVPESDIEAGCIVIVEDGVTPQRDSIERTVFVDGATRMHLDSVMLTEATSKRLSGSPEWSLSRVSGNNLTLRAAGYETVSENGDPLYGCELTLYSVSRTGDTVYDLTCTADGETATVRVTVHAVNRDDLLPASIELSQTVYEADVDQLILVQPEVTCWPENTQLPNGLVVSFEGGKQFIEALNAEDFYASQSLSTFSFSEPGTYEANCIYTYSNVRFTIPVTFRIRDEEGNVPVQASGVKLNHKNLNMVIGDEATLAAVFTPVETTNQQVSWTSSDESIVTVDANGVVTAKANGMATITCTPADTHCDPVQCAVTVEDYFTIETGALSSTLYKQGRQANDLSAAWLSDGTVERLAADGLTAEWSIDLTGISHSEIASSVSEDGNKLSVATSALLSGGEDVYAITCTAGEYSWTQEYALNVVDLGVNAPESIRIATEQIDLQVGETAEIDFTPVLEPEEAKIPEEMISYYVGLGEFYNAMTAYEENGDTVTVGFGLAGRYVITRQYFLNNLRYTTACTVNVSAQQSESYDLLSATETEFTVYTGGKSGSVSTVSITDGMIAELWGDEIEWTATRLSGNSLTVALKANGSSADVFVADAEQNGTDVWRIACSFGGMTDYVDIELTAADPRGEIPESISLSKDHLKGMIGNWITLPLGVSCQPEGAVLPDQGDDFWSFTFDSLGEDVSDHVITNGMLLVRFAESGYYCGRLTYRSGNVSYTLPVYFTVSDEEGVVAAPEMSMWLADTFDTVYPEGKTGVAIGLAIVADNLSTYAAGESLAYMESAQSAWAVNVSDGTAAKLSLQKLTANVYEIVLDEISATGDVNYVVSCTMDGQAYVQHGALHVADETEERPDATLKRTAYNAKVGEPITIDSNLYSCKDGSILQSSTSWNADGLLSAIGYEYETEESGWTATFYKAGTYTSTVCGQVSNLEVEAPLTITVTEDDAPAALTVLTLPAALTTIEANAFQSVSANMVDLRGTKVTSIGAGAFRNCVDMVAAYLPESVTSIGDNAFYGCLNITIYCAKGSPAETYANNNGLAISYID